MVSNLLSDRGLFDRSGGPQDPAGLIGGGSPHVREKIRDVTINVTNVTIEEHTHNYQLLDHDSIDARNYEEGAYRRELGIFVEEQDEIGEDEVLEVLKEQIAAMNTGLIELRQRVADTIAHMEAMDEAAKGDG